MHIVFKKTSWSYRTLVALRMLAWAGHSFIKNKKQKENKHTVQQRSGIFTV